MNGQERPQRRLKWDIGAALFCFLFGIALIANIHPNGDGLWFFYSEAVLHRQRLYSDLHLNLQPFFVLLTSLFIRLLGPAWLAFKVMPCLQVLVYCTGLLLIVRRMPLSDWSRGLLLVAVFGLTITTPFYRFDDYHITTQIFQIYALLLFLRMLRGVSPSAGICISASLGLLCGLSTSNRLNDGAALFAACLLALPFLLPARRLWAIFTLCVATGIGLFSTILLTGDSIAAWHTQSITMAARVKGGTGSILFTPLVLPVKLLKGLLHPGSFAITLGVVLLTLLLAYDPEIFQAPIRRWSRKDYSIAGTLALASLLWLWPGAHGKANATLGLAGGLLLLAAGCWTLVLITRFAWQLDRAECNHNYLLTLVPFWGLVGAALTSGIFLPDYEPSVAVFLLIVPLLIPRLESNVRARRSLMFVCWLVAIAFIPAKITVPYQWHTYHSDPMFVDRTIYKHPVFGPMIIEKPQLAFMQRMCQTITADGSQTTLLALPYPYPNYFCNIAPWHDYVQTWYDTSSKETISALQADLSKVPPKWILYQRGLNTIAVHEQALGPGRVLPHRALDSDILANIEQQHWTIVRRECFEGSDWLLMRTTPPQPGEHQGATSDADDRSASCAASGRYFWHSRF